MARNRDYVEMLEPATKCLFDVSHIFFEMGDRINDLTGDSEELALPVVLTTLLAGEMAAGVAVHCSQKKLAPAIALGRSAFEAAINACYIMAEGKEAARRAKAHYQQKTVRSVEREITAGGLGMKFFRGDPAPPIPEDVERAVRAFTTSRGKEIRSWTSESIEKRIDVIVGRFGTRAGWSLLFGLATTYRYGSEVIHGTAFGASYAFGFLFDVDNPPKKRPEDKRVEECFYLSAVLSFVMTTLADCLVELWPDACGDIGQRVNALNDELVQRMRDFAGQPT